jgi:hypothetical protein
MKPQQPKPRPRKPGRSGAQREWTAAVACASGAWELLTDAQRLEWNVAAETRRTSGHRYFVSVNARRFRDGQEMLTTPPKPEPPRTRRVLKQLVITNQRGRLTLKLEGSLPPNARFTVWGSRPCNQGISAYHKCPRLGPLPDPENGWSNISELYFQKHGAYIKANSVQTVGKRIVIRLRQEFDTGPAVYEEVRAVVPPPEGRARRAKRG